MTSRRPIVVEKREIPIRYRARLMRYTSAPSPPVRQNPTLLVDDPHGIPTADDPKPQARVEANLRDDRLGDLYSRELIDRYQYYAGRKWQSIAERCTLGPVRAIDPCKEPVDGGRVPEVLTDKQRGAMDEMRRVQACVGLEGHVLLVNVLIHQRRFAELAEKPNRWQEDKVSQHFRGCLDRLAVFWGLATAPERFVRRHNHVRVWRER